MKLTERRARFVYEAARLAATAANAPVVSPVWAERSEAFVKQFLEVVERQCSVEGLSSTAESLHDDWVMAYLKMGWQYGEYNREKKTHPDLIPFNKLSPLERDKDFVFIALCKIATKWIY